MKTKKRVDVHQVADLVWKLNLHIPITWDPIWKYGCLTYLCRRSFYYIEENEKLPTESMLRRWTNDYKAKKNLS